MRVCPAVEASITEPSTIGARRFPTLGFGTHGFDTH